MLPAPALEPLYDRLVWVYVYNDFKEGEADRAATRTRLRLGVSSWPQLLLVEPGTLAVVGETGRTVESFLAAAKAVRVKRPAADAHEALVAAERLAQRLETTPDLESARAALRATDPAVLVPAIRHLAANAPAILHAEAERLLRMPNDPVRYAVCEALAAAPAGSVPPATRAALVALLADPGESRNPNVVRIHAAKALGACGGPEAVETLRPHAASGDVRNGLTGTAVDAVAAIGTRDPKARVAAVAILRDALPGPPDDDAMAKAVAALAKRVHGALERLTGRDVPFPDPWTADARERLRAAFGDGTR